jgi:hypothetical protein
MDHNPTTNRTTIRPDFSRIIGLVAFTAVFVLLALWAKDRHDGGVNQQLLVDLLRECSSCKEKFSQMVPRLPPASKSVAMQVLEVVSRLE